MDKYNAILNKLQHTAPIVTDPEGLTQRIMKEIEQPVIRRRSKIRIIMTGIAASVLSVLPEKQQQPLRKNLYRRL